jgi:hypothetical protein
MAEFGLNDFLSRRFSERVPYQDEKLMDLPKRCAEHRPVLTLGLSYALHVGVLYGCISRARILPCKALR